MKTIIACILIALLFANLLRGIAQAVLPITSASTPCRRAWALRAGFGGMVDGCFVSGVLFTFLNSFSMKILTEGHRYELPNFENPSEKGQEIQFIHKDTDPSGVGMSGDGVTLHTMSDDTTNEAVLGMLIDRLQFLQKKFPCRENAIVITKLEESLMWLEKRTADRVKRNVEGKHLA